MKNTVCAVKAAENFYQNCGLYFSSDEYTDDFEKQVAVVAVYLKNQKELEEFVGALQSALKSRIFGRPLRGFDLCGKILRFGDGLSLSSAGQKTVGYEENCPLFNA